MTLRQPPGRGRVERLLWWLERRLRNRRIRRNFTAEEEGFYQRLLTGDPELMYLHRTWSRQETGPLLGTPDLVMYIPTAYRQWRLWKQEHGPSAIPATSLLEEALGPWPPPPDPH